MNDPTTRFLTLLTGCALKHTVVDRDTLRAVCESPMPFNPLDASCGPGTSEDRHAVRKGFRSLLESKETLDWNRIRTQSAKLEEFLETQHESRDQEHSNTRGVTLFESNYVFDFTGWTMAWSRRNLESVVGFFRSDGLWIDLTLEIWAQGKRELRERLARFFHSFEGEMRVASAKHTVEDHEVELEWSRSGPRIPGRDFQNLGSGTVGGKSNLWVRDRLISMCVDTTNSKDLEQIALGSWGSGKQETGGTIVQRETMVTVNDVKLNKPYRFKKDLAKAPGERNQ